MDIIIKWDENGQELVFVREPSTEQHRHREVVVDKVEEEENV